MKRTADEEAKVVTWKHICIAFDAFKSSEVQWVQIFLFIKYSTFMAGFAFYMA